MSKVGENPIQFDQNTSVTQENYVLTVKGSKGEMQYEIPHELDIRIEDTTVYVSRKRETKRHKSLHGLYRTLIANAIRGVNEVWQKRLEIQGTGFNAKQQGKGLVFKVGYSHPVNFEPPEGITLATEGNTTVIVSGVNKQLVGEVAKKIKEIKKPDPYKGKGIRYEGEEIKLKPGKKAKAE